MKCSEQWLREWVNPTASTQQLVEQYTMAGLEVDAVTPVAAHFSGVVVGEILTCDPHPNADKLRVCQVQVGLAEALTIVCGAANAAPGLKAPTALIGAQLPGIAIQKSKLRGVESFGMLCSATELGLAENASGLLPLPSDAPVGMDIREYLGLNDVCIDIDLTPNRGDCLSIQGIARETGALHRCALTPPKMPAIAPVIADAFPVDIHNPSACPRYVGRVIRGIAPGAQTPLWLRERLRRSGIRAIHPVVDVTNYVLLELGQPMHAFDLAQLHGGIIVRNAHAGETLELLDGQEITLQTNDLVIADHAHALALAGVMGGKSSAVTEHSTDIFLESAYFAPQALAGCARRHGLQTDSSYRFERGVDPALQVQAIERATALLLAITGGQPGPILEQVHMEHVPQPQVIRLRAQRIAQILGVALDTAEITATLARLGMGVRSDGDEWWVTPPSFRHDIGLEIDLIEEVARIHGYNNLPTAPTTKVQARMRPMAAKTAREGKRILVERGYREAITYSFVDERLQQKIAPHAQAILLANPLAADMAAMRVSLWPGLLNALRHNWQRQQKDIRLFETGLRFLAQNSGEIRQQPMIAGVATGLAHPAQWGVAARPVDFFDVKNDVERLLQALPGENPGVVFQAHTHPALHPGQTAQILRNGQAIGWLGAIHPSLASEWELPDQVFLFELELAAIVASVIPRYQLVSKFPSLRRDLALVVDKTVLAADLLAEMQNFGGELLTNVHLFDIYEGKGIPTEKKSMAAGLTFRSTSRNLTEEEVDAAIAQILSSLARTFQATLRE